MQLVLLLRKPKFETPSDMDARLRLIEQSLQAVVQGHGRIDGASQSLERRLQALADNMGTELAASRREIDEQLSRTVDEGRGGRTDLMRAFQSFGAEQDLRQTALGTSLTRQFSEFQRSTSDGLEGSRRVVNEQLTNIIEEARKGRAELSAAFASFEAGLEQRINGLDLSLTARFEGLQQRLSAQLDETGKTLMAHLAQAGVDSTSARTEMTQTLGTFREEVSGTLRTLSEETSRSRQALNDSSTVVETRTQERFEALTQVARETLESLKTDVTAQLSLMASAMRDQLDGNGRQLGSQFTMLQESVTQKLQAMASAGQQSSDQMRSTLNERLASIQDDNSKKLEEMRRTVDEKLHATLEQRLGDSFKLVSDRLELVHTGLGEMKNLAGSVGDLKRVMSNVRARGTWGEVQLGAIIESLLTTDQYRRNVKTMPNSNDLVEFAIRMPGKTDETPVWLPIDSKYPVEHYQRLMDAHESLDKVQVQQAVSAFEASIRSEARKIAAKYLSPPGTTDFAILFVPTEGLFAEVMRIPGLHEALQNDHRVMVAGPTTLGALLNSLRLGFRTLAIEKRSSEVWSILGTVKTEFHKFGQIVESTKNSITAAANKFDELGRRTRAIERGLRNVEELPVGANDKNSIVSLLCSEDDEREPTATLMPGTTTIAV
jgi:DNA recombination protein RmuC